MQSVEFTIFSVSNDSSNEKLIFIGWLNLFYGGWVEIHGATGRQLLWSSTRASFDAQGGISRPQAPNAGGNAVRHSNAANLSLQDLSGTEVLVLENFSMYDQRLEKEYTLKAIRANVNYRATVAMVSNHLLDKHVPIPVITHARNPLAPTA
jgi:hypothetical protein